MHQRIYYNVGRNVYKCLYMRQITRASPTAESYSSRIQLLHYELQLQSGLHPQL